MRRIMLPLVLAGFLGIDAVSNLVGQEVFGGLDVMRIKASFAGRHKGATARSRDHETRKNGDASLMTAPVEAGAVEEVIVATGALHPVEVVEVGSQIAGEVTDLFVDFNDEVKRGQPLAQLDRRNYEARLDEQKALLAAAEADRIVLGVRLERARIDLELVKAGRLALVVRLDGATRADSIAKSNYQRQTLLRARETVTARTLDAAALDVASVGTSLKEAQVGVEKLPLQVRAAEAAVREVTAELARADAAIAQRRATIASAAADLDRTLIRSPIDGVVVGRFINRGQTLTENIENHPVFSIARRLDEMEVRARVDETDIGRIRVGQRAGFTVDAYPGRRFEGVVRQVRKAPEVTQNVVTYTVVVKTANPDGLLLPGMTAMAKLVADPPAGSLKVPAAALRYAPKVAQAGGGTPSENPGDAVWVVDEKGVRRVPVSPGASDDEMASVSGPGLSPGDRVVVGDGPRDIARAGL